MFCSPGRSTNSASVAGRSAASAEITASRHAALECHGPRIVLRDLGSRNGTFVAGQTVSHREVESDNEFQLGGTTFLLIVANE